MFNLPYSGDRGTRNAQEPSPHACGTSEMRPRHVFLYTHIHTHSYTNRPKTRFVCLAYVPVYTNMLEKNKQTGFNYTFSVRSSSFNDPPQVHIVKQVKTYCKPPVFFFLNTYYPLNVRLKIETNDGTTQCSRLLYGRAIRFNDGLTTVVTTTNAVRVHGFRSS